MTTHADSPPTAPTRPPVRRRASTGARVLAAAGALAGLTVLGLAAWITPDAAGHGTHTQLGLPDCAWAQAFDKPCATCGMTTSFAHASHGDILGSASTQPFGFLLAVVTAAGGVGRGPRRGHRLDDRRRGGPIAQRQGALGLCRPPAHRVGVQIHHLDRLYRRTLTMRDRHSTSVRARRPEGPCSRRATRRARRPAHRHARARRVRRRLPHRRDGVLGRTDRLDDVRTRVHGARREDLRRRRVGRPLHPVAIPGARAQPHPTCRSQARRGGQRQRPCPRRRGYPVSRQPPAVGGVAPQPPRRRVGR
ncbi:MAG: DUF2752 domain-containing protein [Planctomycetota bacterium]|nr:MAG: DUF2752 domain-containing protein [Planctomycetota bacterium]